MHRFVSLLLVLAMLLVSVGPALAQDDVGSPTAGDHIYLPLISTETGAQSGPPMPEAAAPDGSVAAAAQGGNGKGNGNGNGKGNCNGNGNGNGNHNGCNKPNHFDRKAAAARRFQQGALNPLMLVEPQAQAAELPAIQAAALVDGAPHYFSHPNYANSPLPSIDGSQVYVGNPLIDRAYATDFATGVEVGSLAPVFVVLPTALPDGFLILQPHYGKRAVF